MPVYPSLKTDSILYERSDVYADADIKITLLDGSQLEIWGTFFVNGSPIQNIGSLPIATQAEAEAGTDNTKVMTPLRAKQAITFQAKAAVLVGSGGGTTTYLRADGTWAVPVSAIADGDKGDIVVSGSGATWLFDSSVVTAAAKTVLDDASVAAMLATLGGLPLAGGRMTGSLTMADGQIIQTDTSGVIHLYVPGTGGLIKFSTNGFPRLILSDTAATFLAGSTVVLGKDPTNPLEGATKSYVDVGDALFTSGAKGTVPGSGGGSTNFLRADGTWSAPPTGTISDGDKGEISVTSGVWTIDNAVVTNAKMANMALLSIKGNNLGSAAAPSDLTQSTVRNMLNINLVDNTSDANKPVSTAQNTAINLKADKTTSISTTAPLTGGGDLSANRTLDISNFTTSTKGTVPSPGSSTGKFLMDDGTWAAPASSLSGVGGVFPFTYNTSNVEPPTGNQLRGNNATFASSTKLWIMETTTDGLDVTVGLGRIKAGFQIYVQNYNNSAQYAIWNVTADATDKGAYWEVTVSPSSSAGTIPGGKIALQSLSAAQASNLFSTTSTAPGLTPGSNSVGSTYFLNGVGAWAVPAGGGGVTDGDKGDIVVSASGATWMLDSTVVTAAAKTVLDDTTTAAMLTTLGAQPVDSDLTTIAGLTATTNNIIQSVGSAWSSVTPANVKTSLSLTKSDVGLSNVDNTSDATQDAATSTLTNKTLTDPKINLAINAQTGTTYTLVLTDNNKVLTHSNAAAITVTVPPNSSVAFPVGSQITLIQIGAGKVTVAQGSGVTVNGTPSLGFRAQYSACTLIKTATDQWYLMGDLA